MELCVLQGLQVIFIELVSVYILLVPHVSSDHQDCDHIIGNSDHLLDLLIRGWAFYNWRDHKIQTCFMFAGFRVPKALVID